MTDAYPDILTLLPQRPPFVMVDRLVHFDPVRTVTELEVRADNLFFERGALSAEGLLENIAQTCAARMGYINRMAAESVKVGVIGAIRNLKIERLPHEGERLTTAIEVSSEVFQMTIVNATTTSDGQPIASGQMTIALTDIDAKA